MEAAKASTPPRTRHPRQLTRTPLAGSAGKGKNRKFQRLDDDEGDVNNDDDSDSNDDRTALLAPKKVFGASKLSGAK